MPGLQKIPKETILAAIEKIGPSQPIDIRKEIKQGDTFLIGAMLSEFVANGELAISRTRRGGSPFYYNAKKPETLEKISQYLNEKDRRTCAMLREQKVMREDEQEPLVRVGLQNIHDFAQRLVIKEGDAEIVYWRYFLTPEAEAKMLLKSSAPAKAESAEASAAKPAERPAVPAETPAQKPVEKSEPKPAMREEAAEASPAEKSEHNAEIKMPSPALHSEEPKPAKKRATRAKAAASPASQPSLQDWLIHDTLYEKVQQYAVGAKGILTHQQSIKPNSELTCVLSNDSHYGRLSVFVLALNKKKVAEKDITTGLLAARGQGMPLLVLSVEPVPAKIAKNFESTLNVYFKPLG